MRQLLLSVGVAVLLAAGCASEAGDDQATSAPMEPPATAVSATEPTTTTTAPPATEPVTVSGPGDMSTNPFTLSGGRHQVHYRFDGDCFYGASLEPVDGGLLLADLGTGMGPVEGDTNVYDLASGDYYVRVITGPAPGCGWEITLTPSS